MKKKFINFIFTILLVPIGLLFAEDLSITGGTLYSGWSKDSSSMRGGITFTAPVASAFMRDPIQLMFVVDVSRSMEGAVYKKVKDGIRATVRQLGERDMFGLVAFSQQARLLCGLQPCNQTTRKVAENTIDRMRLDVGRNLEAGFAEAMEQFVRTDSHRNGGRYCFIITAGDPTVGQKDLSYLVKSMVKMATKHNVRIITLGYERNFSEDLFISLAKKSGGRALFVEEDSLETIRYKIQREAERILSPVFMNISIEIIPPKGARFTPVSTVMQDNDGYMHFSSISSGYTIPLFFDIISRPEKQRDCEIYVEYEDPHSGSSQSSELYIELPFLEGSPSFDEENGPLIMEFTIKKLLAETISEILLDKKNARLSYLEKYKLMVKNIEAYDISMHSEKMASVVEQLKKLEHDIENFAIDNNLLAKRIKYTYCSFIDGWKVQ